MTKDPFRGRTGRAVVNDVAVRRMRFLHSYKGVPAAVLAAEYNLGIEACKRILKWQSWRHVSEVGPGATEQDFLAVGAPQAPGQASQAEKDAIAASQKRLLGMLEAEGVQMPALVPPAAEALPSLEEMLRRAAEAEGPSPGLARLNEEVAKLRRGDQVLEELTGHGNVAGVECPIPPANGGTLTDGGSK